MEPPDSLALMKIETDFFIKLFFVYIKYISCRFLLINKSRIFNKRKRQNKWSDLTRHYTDVIYVYGKSRAGTSFVSGCNRSTS